MMPGIWEKCQRCYKMNHFKEVCQSSKRGAVHHMETEADHEQETDTKMVNINSFKFNSNHFCNRSKSKTSSNKVIITVPYKVGIGCDGNIMPLYIYKFIS